MLFSGRSLVALVPEIFFEAHSINSDGWSSMSRFKEERIDGCFFRATYSGKGGAYDLTTHYSLLMWRNNRAESPMRLCTTHSVLKYYGVFVFLEISTSDYIRSKMGESTL